MSCEYISANHFLELGLNLPPRNLALLTLKGFDHKVNEYSLIDIPFMLITARRAMSYQATLVNK